MHHSPYLPVVEVLRGKIVESIHYGAVAVSDSQGRLTAWYGDPDVYTFLRSSAKPFQALPFLESGGQDRFGLTDQEVALICASHSGTDEHVDTIGSIQAKTGVREAELLCGTHPPFHRATAERMCQQGKAPTPNRHNCSGKHTGMLAYTRIRDAISADLPYIHPQHPIQKDILQVLAEMCSVSHDQVELGIDGCSVPTFAVPLRRAAQALARLYDPQGFSTARMAACQTVTRAMTTHPDMVGGPDSFDTHLMQATGGRILSKGGAEGYQAMALPAGAAWPGSPALGIAIKISDGDLGAHSRPHGDMYGHARPLVALEVLRQLGAIRPDELESLSGFGPEFTIQNWRKLEVGLACPVFQLERMEIDGSS